MKRHRNWRKVFSLFTTFRGQVIYNRRNHLKRTQVSKYDTTLHLTFAAQKYASTWYCSLFFTIRVCLKRRLSRSHHWKVLMVDYKSIAYVLWSCVNVLVGLLILNSLLCSRIKLYVICYARAFSCEEIAWFSAFNESYVAQSLSESLHIRLVIIDVHSQRIGISLHSWFHSLCLSFVFTKTLFLLIWTTGINYLQILFVFWFRLRSRNAVIMINQAIECFNIGIKLFVFS